MSVTISGSGVITGTTDVAGVPAFDSVATITATDASWPVPSLDDSIVKVTVIGGGAGGGGCEGARGVGAAGGSSSFATAAGTATALGGRRGIPNVSAVGEDARNGLVAGNGGGGASFNTDHTSSAGLGGEVTVAYYDLNGITTANVTIGAGGAGGAGERAGGDGGDGIVIFEYKAG